jgi:hypothetical protein
MEMARTEERGMEGRKEEKGKNQKGFGGIRVKEERE